eukprot:14659515-Alexandrium_andersonii.AAC.1
MGPQPGIAADQAARRGVFSSASDRAAKEAHVPLIQERISQNPSGAVEQGRTLTKAAPGLVGALIED